MITSIPVIAAIRTLKVEEIFTIIAYNQCQIPWLFSTRDEMLDHIIKHELVNSVSFLHATFRGKYRLKSFVRFFEDSVLETGTIEGVDFQNETYDILLYRDMSKPFWLTKGIDDLF